MTSFKRQVFHIFSPFSYMILIISSKLLEQTKFFPLTNPVYFLTFLKVLKLSIPLLAVSLLGQYLTSGVKLHTTVSCCEQSYGLTIINKLLIKSQIKLLPITQKQ